MEKLVHLLWRDDAHDEAGHRDQLVGELSAALLASSAGIAQLEVLTGDTSEAIPRPPLMFGKGPDLASAVVTWVDCIDDRRSILEVLASAVGTTGVVDQYLVTESVPQRFAGRDWPDGVTTPGVTHFSWFPKPDRLTDAEFFHGWHEVHTPSTPALHPLRREYVRDSVARVLTEGSAPIRAVVAERFAPIGDYTDPKRLYGSKAAMEESGTGLALYADFESLNCRPLFQSIIRG